MNFTEKLNSLIEKYSNLGEKLLDPMALGNEYAKVSKEYSDMTLVVEKAKEYNSKNAEYADTLEMLEDKTLDKEMRQVVEEEMYELKKILPKLEQEIKIALLPRDSDDDKDAILEVRAGTGGEEAALFAGVLLKMYQRYAENHRWSTEILSISETGIGGVKEASMSIKGRGVFAHLKFESGVHRVQRVPETESQGRVHTSAATVAVLPEVEEVDVDIQEKDLRIDIFRASGPGGQCVNTTDSAVRIVHIPTGIVVQQQDEKSQHKNKEKAMKILRARIYEMEKSKRDAERAADRKEQVGSGDRSERIRTYNYPQNRVTDHRINLTLYKIDAITNGGELDEIIEALTADDELKRLNAVE